MKTLIFSCLHVPVHKTYGSEALLPTIDWLTDQVRVLGVDNIVFLGDSIDNSSKTWVPVNLILKRCIDKFRGLARTGVNVFWLIGNHDIYSNDMHAIQIFDPGHCFQIISKPCSIDVGEYCFAFLPFLRSMDKGISTPELGLSKLCAGKPTALFAHIPIEGMPIGGTKDRGISAADLSMFDIVFDGHYHEATQFIQDLNGITTPFVVPGSVLAQTFRDTGWFHGAVLWDGIRVSWLSNPHTHYFLKTTAADLEARQDLAAIRSRLHVRLTDVEIGSKALSDGTLASVESRPDRSASESSSKAPFRLDSSVEEDLRRWCEENGTSGADAVVSRGKQYMEAA